VRPGTRPLSPQGKIFFNPDVVEKWAKGEAD
jgi:hypothetical protein